ncbi:hypothetical protein WOLCODRAFT_113269 [Wolfiporia cocos MD-104 SS10]|uniref:Uncharacterized protein n=1 Tax=Wolfiporia cocos (strain MD-104) TaxID=742152 RepID=A0A2H3IVZ0_WOLCO|nr:hypothetical protein WOLCODRAFT_113269 [Wolfiporia cocos MD-104 SS10]
MQDAPLKIRILLDYSNTISAAATLADPLPSPDPMSVSWVAGKPTEPMMRTLLDIRLDTCPTSPSLFTRTKTTHRLEYTAARARMSIPPLPAPSNADVLLYNPSGEITETSIRNVAFWRRAPPQWVTPHAEVGCLPGVMRRWLLEQGRIVEAQVGELVKDDLVEGEYILTFNGVEGCRIGRIALPSR